jgi:hypothetical protein
MLSGSNSVTTRRPILGALASNASILRSSDCDIAYSPASIHEMTMNVWRGLAA